jgi:hypothetical protein
MQSMQSELNKNVLFRLIGDTLHCEAHGVSEQLNLPRAEGGSLGDLTGLQAKLASFRDTAGISVGDSVVCGIPARGVSLRRVKLPTNGSANVDQMLRFQVEKEFPLSPEELAWGWREIQNSAAGSEYLIGALKGDLIEPLASLFRSADLVPMFTPSILTAGLTGQNDGSFTVAEIADGTCEWARFEAGVPVAIRSLSRNGDDLDSLTGRLAKLSGDSSKFRVFSDVGVEEPLRAGLSNAGFLGTIESEGQPKFADIETVIGNGNFAKVPLMVSSTTAPEPVNRLQGLPLNWIGIAAALAVALFASRYAEPYLAHAGLHGKLDAFEKEKESLPAITQELTFLQHIQKNQPPYLAALAIFSDSAPRGTKIESLNLDRRGDFTFRGQMQGSQQATELRSKLIASGLFDSVVLEEQSTVPNKREVKVRFTARWKTARDVKSDALKRIDATAETADAKKSPSSERRSTSPRPAVRSR